MPLQLESHERGFLSQIQSFAAKAVGADRIYKIIREFFGVKSGDPAPIRRSVVRDVVREFRNEQYQRFSNFPTKRSERFKVEHSLKTEFKSPLGYRYLLDFQFKVTNPLTGESKTLTNTIGFNRLDRLGAFQDEARDRLSQINQLDQTKREIYELGEGFIADLDSIQFVGLYRTLER